MGWLLRVQVWEQGRLCGQMCEACYDDVLELRLGGGSVWWDGGWECCDLGKVAVYRYRNCLSERNSGRHSPPGCPKRAEDWRTEKPR